MRWNAKVLTVVFILTVLPFRSVLGDGEKGYPRLMEGPMIGFVSDRAARIWFRASGPFDVGALVSTDPSMANSRGVGPVRAEKSKDYTGVLTVDGLNPAVRYYYKITVDGGGDKYQRFDPPPSFRTLPPEGKPGRFKIAFGSCNRVQEDSEQKIWNAVAAEDPDLFLFIGDNIYGDALDPDILREQYRWNRHVRSRAAMMRATPQVAVWDDHDFGLNNSDGSHPAKEGALAAFMEYWANPSYGLPDAPGVFFRFSIGDVDFFMLDDRYHRSPNAAPDGPEKTHLGAAQKAWLKDGLRKSAATFKVLASGGGWNDMKGPTGDSWSAYLTERNELFDFIRDEKIEGVLLLSGDTHMGEMNVIPWSKNGGYDYYELVSSPLAMNPPKGAGFGAEFKRVRPAVNAVNYGLVEFDTTSDPPRARLSLKGADGQPAWKPVLIAADELKNGVSSWKKNTRF